MKSIPCLASPKSACIENSGGAAGLAYIDLITKLINLALEQHARIDALQSI